jgi:hypothetical protein
VGNVFVNLARPAPVLHLKELRQKATVDKQTSRATNQGNMLVPTTMNVLIVKLERMAVTISTVICADPGCTMMKKVK